MKIGSIISIFLFSCLLETGNVNAQTFRKGSLLLSLTEGSTYAHFTTSDNSTSPAKITDGNICGDRDPIILEYGLSNKWGIGINMGGDILHVNPTSFYNVHTTATQLITSELSLEANYHFLVTKKFDLSACGSLGFASVHFEGNEGDGGAVHDYNAGGGIIRLSAKARYYFFRRFGVLCILSAYSSSCTPDADKDNSIQKQTTTRISGYSFEFGLCYRILK